MVRFGDQHFHGVVLARGFRLQVVTGQLLVQIAGAHGALLFARSGRVHTRFLGKGPFSDRSWQVPFHGP